MSTGDVVLVAGIVLCALAFAALAVTLVRVLDALGELRAEVISLRSETAPLLTELRDSTDDAREVIDEARSDLARFDRVLGSAEALSASATRARTTLSVPMIKAAGLATGTSRGAPLAAGRMMRRAVWFVGGVATGVAGAGYAKRKVTVAARRLAPSNVARGATGSVKRTGRRVADAVREGRTAARVRERELLAERDGRLVRMGDHLQPGDELLVDGEPVESGRVILMRRRDRTE